MNTLRVLTLFVAIEHSGITMIGQGVKAPAKAWLSTSEAAQAAEVDQSTVIRWCQKFGTPLARRVRGRWRISPDALAKLLRGEDLGDRKKA